MDSPAQPLRLDPVQLQAEQSRHAFRSAPQPHETHAWEHRRPGAHSHCTRCGAATGTPHGLQPCPRDPIHGMATALQEHPLRIGAAADQRTVPEVMNARHSTVGCCDKYTDLGPPADSGCHDPPYRRGPGAI